MSRRLLGLSLVIALATGCADEPSFVADRSTCPGQTCADDTRDRLEAIAELGRVTGVTEVSRSTRLDRGSSSSAVVRAEVTTDAEARAVGEEVLRALDAWPDHEAASSLVTVHSDPAVAVSGVAREAERLAPGFYRGCSPAECDAALTEIEDRVEAAYDGVDATVRVTGGRLIVGGIAPRDRAALAARAAVRVLRQTGLRVAPRAEVAIRWRAPLSVTLRLEDGLVCEQPDGVVVSCEAANSDPISG